MEKVAVVVLNYKNYHDTIECVDSLLLQQGIILHVVIVDNNSGNESLEILQTRYSAKKRVKLIANNENLGFSKGNNVGIKYAHDIKGYKYIFVLNSDTELPSPSIILDILTAHSSNIAVISPIVTGVDGKMQEPTLYSTNALWRQSAFTFLYVLTNSLFPKLIKFIITFKRRFIGGRKARKKSTEIMRPGTPNNNVYAIQGSAYMLTPDFFRYYTQLYPKTFLYWEEFCLSCYLHKVQLQTALAKNQPIIHKGGRSTSIGLNDKHKEQIRTKHVISGFHKILPLLFIKYRTIYIKYN